MQIAETCTQEAQAVTFTEPVRFHFIDGLRGIAALLVVVFHVWHNAGLGAAVAGFCPHWLDAAMLSFGRGVDLFFVISGFVIAHSIRSMRVSTYSAANFALRRQIRLDPPYWICLFATLILTVLASRRSPDIVVMPSIGEFFLNLFYLQNIAHVPNIVRVAWTLCLEVQFYLVFIIIVGLAQRCRPERTATVALMMTVSCLSLAWASFLPGSPWFISTWYLFAMGVLAYWVFSKKIHWAWLAGLLSVALISGTVRSDTGPIVAALATLVVVAVAQSGKLTTWMAGTIFGYFGAISYSLYLVHFDVVSIVFRTGRRLTGSTVLSALAWSICGIAISIALAHVLNKTVERPSARLASRLKRSVPEASRHQLQPVLA